MKIRIPDTVPDECVPGYLSKGKEYNAEHHFCGVDIAYITGDDGRSCAVTLSPIIGCWHIGGHAWEVLE